MIAEAPNSKAMQPSNDEPGTVTLKAVSGIKNEYHFAGVPHWKPLAIIASTYEEAVALWKQQRQPAATAQAAEPEKQKVEAAKETTNDNQ